MSEEKEETARMLQYFWEEKQDIECWTEFNREKIKEVYPEVIKAWDDYNTSVLLMNAVMRGINT